MLCNSIKGKWKGEWDCKAKANASRWWYQTKPPAGASMLRSTSQRTSLITIQRQYLLTLSTCLFCSNRLILLLYSMRNLRKLLSSRCSLPVIPWLGANPNGLLDLEHSTDDIISSRMSVMIELRELTLESAQNLGHLKNLMRVKSIEDSLR